MSLSLRLAGVGVALVAAGGCAAERWPTYSRESRIEIPPGVRIAHGLGGVRERVKSNSLDAWRESLERGYVGFEVDLALTSDGALACVHEGHIGAIGLADAAFDITLEDFLSRSFGEERFELMAFGRLLVELGKEPDAWLVTDSKGLPPEMLERIVTEIDAVDPDLRRRIIIQIYRPEELETVLAAETGGSFGGVILTLYQHEIGDDDLLAFVEKSGIEWVTMSHGRFSARLAERLHAVGAKVFVHTLNGKREIAEFTADGVDGIYTDWAAPMPAPDRITRGQRVPRAERPRIRLRDSKKEARRARRQQARSRARALRRR